MCLGKVRVGSPDIGTYELHCELARLRSSARECEGGSYFVESFEIPRGQALR